MEVNVGVGLDNLIFGMSQEEIKSILGEPNKINNDELDYGIVYYFNKEMITTKFDEEEGLKLYSIDVYNTDVILLKQKIIGKSIEDIKNILIKNGYSNFEYEDYHSFDILYCEEICATFMFEFNRLKSIEFSPLYINENDIAWPEKTL